MTQNKANDRLFVPEKIKWMLDGGLESLDAGERQMLLIMAETKIQEGYKPSKEERQVVEKLKALAGQEYDAKDISAKVKTMVKGKAKQDASFWRLPPVFNRLRKRLQGDKEQE